MAWTTGLQSILGGLSTFNTNNPQMTNLINQAQYGVTGQNPNLFSTGYGTMPQFGGGFQMPQSYYQTMGNQGYQQQQYYQQPLNTDSYIDFGGVAGDDYSVEEFKKMMKPMIGKTIDELGDYQDAIEEGIEKRLAEWEAKGYTEDSGVTQEALIQSDPILMDLVKRQEIVEYLVDNEESAALLFGDDGKFSNRDVDKIAARDEGDTINGGSKSTINFETDLNTDYEGVTQYEEGKFTEDEIADALDISGSDTITQEEIESLRKATQRELNEHILDMPDFPELSDLEAQKALERKLEILEFLGDDDNFEVIARADEANDWVDGNHVPAISLAEIATVAEAGDDDIDNMQGLTRGDVKEFEDTLFDEPKKELAGVKADAITDIAFTGLNAFSSVDSVKSQIETLGAKLATAENQEEYTQIKQAMYLLEYLVETWDDHSRTSNSYTRSEFEADHVEPNGSSSDPANVFTFENEI